MTEQIKWMTEIPERCDHPKECIRQHFNIWENPSYICEKCGHKMDVYEYKNKYIFYKGD